MHPTMRSNARSLLAWNAKRPQGTPAAVRMTATGVLPQPPEKGGHGQSHGRNTRRPRGCYAPVAASIVYIRCERNINGYNGSSALNRRLCHPSIHRASVSIQQSCSCSRTTRREPVDQPRSSPQAISMPVTRRTYSRRSLQMVSSPKLYAGAFIVFLLLG